MPRALAHAHEAIARLDELGGGAGAGHLWVGVMTAEAMLGRADTARAAGRTAYALLLREGDELRTFRGLAVCALRRGTPADAARIDGYVEAALQRAGVLRDSYPMVDSAAVASGLREALPAAELAPLRAEGAAMREEDVVRLALGTDDDIARDR